MPGQNILIVDDQKEVSSVLRSGLESLEQDLHITEILSGEEAILETNKQNIDLLVSDVILPGMTGLQLMAKLKSKNPDLKVILISGVTDKKIRREVAEAGADAFFFKPIELADFLDGVERALGMVETMLPTELVVEKREADHAKAETISLSDSIASLRQDLDASCVYLMNDLGQVLVRAGEMPDQEVETKLAADIMALILTNNRVSAFLGGSSSKNFTFIQGDSFDLAISPVGRTYALLLACKETTDTTIDKISTLMAAAVKDIFSTLSILGLSTQVSSTGQLKKSATGNLIDPEMEAIFEKAKSKKIKMDDIESFWEELADSDIHKTVSAGDGLSYEEAVELGLGPNGHEN